MSQSTTFKESLRSAEREVSLAEVRTEVLQLLREKRYEDALQFLYWARSKLPRHPELQRSVEQVKELLFGSYAKRLGGLDKVAEPLNPKPKRSPDFLLIARYVDGSSTYGDLAEICPLGRLRTLQLLVEMYCPDGDGRGEPHSGEQLVSRTSRFEQAEDSIDDRAPITTRSSSSLPPPSEHPAGGLAAQGVDSSRQLPSSQTSSYSQRPPSQRPPSRAAPSSRSRDAVPSVGPDGKEYRISQPGEAHPFASKADTPYREAFEKGTSAFVQRRFDEAVGFFEECMKLRPDDTPAQVMLRNCHRELASR